MGTMGDSPPARHSAARAAPAEAPPTFGGPRDAAPVPLNDVETRPERSAKHGQRRGGKDERARPIHHHVAQRAEIRPPTHRPHPTPCLPCGSWPAPAHAAPSSSTRPDAACAIQPGRMRFVDNQQRAKTLGDLRDITKRRQVSIHAEHAFGHDDRAPLSRLLQRRFQSVQILVRIDDRASPSSAGCHRSGWHDCAHRRR